jgi:uncharacterized membrane protein YeaQ/YmgE (transglycosylase-associated protein family)
MDIIGFLLMLLVAAIVGTMGQALSGYSRGGCLVSAFVGMIGALLGGWLAGTLGLPELIVVHVGGWAFPVVYAVVGAALFSIVLGILGRSRRR